MTSGTAENLHLTPQAGGRESAGMEGGLWSLKACTQWHLLQHIHTPKSSTNWELRIQRYKPMVVSFPFKALHLVTSFCLTLHSCKNVNKNKSIKTNSKIRDLLCLMGSCILCLEWRQYLLKCRIPALFLAILLLWCGLSLSLECLLMACMSSFCY